MDAHTDEELERFRQDKSLLEILVAMDDAQLLKPTYQLECAAFALLEVAATNGTFGDLEFGQRRILRKSLGQNLRFALPRFAKSFSIQLRPGYASEVDEARNRRAESELRIYFLERVIHLDKVEKMNRDPALHLAAQETFERAKAAFKVVPRHWHPVDTRQLQKRFAAIADAYENKGYLPPQFTADGRVIPNPHSVSDIRGKRGGPRKKRTRGP